MNKNVPLGSREHQIISIQNFEQVFERMKTLMSEARSVELRLRVYHEVTEHHKAHTGLPFEKFLKFKFTVDRKKSDRMIKAVFSPEKAPRISKIREALDALAHADYVTAKAKIQAVGHINGKPLQVNNSPFNARLIEGIEGEDGKPEMREYVINSTALPNLIIEDFLLFEQQGYATASYDLINEVLGDLQGNSDLGWRYEQVSILRALKDSKKIS